MSKIDQQNQQLKQIWDEGNEEISGETKSEFKALYQSLVQNIPIDHNKLQLAFRRNDIIYSDSLPHQQFHFSAERMVPCLDYYRLHINIGRFRIFANIANYPSSNMSTSQTQSAQTLKNNIYFVNLKERQLCFKTIQFRNQQQFGRVFLRAVKQWSILKICSILEVGPYVQNYLGFDIIIDKNCIHFAMQKGKQIKYLNKYQTKELQKELRLMHQFEIIHCDIKPQNIIFSPHFNKPVFIDFGFSQIIREQIGQKRLTSFKGTPNYCSPEMLQIVIQSNALIDMYYNDAYSLRQTCNYYILKSLKVGASQYQEETNIKEMHKNLYSHKNVDQSDLIFYALQFHYVTQDQLRLKDLVRDYLKSDIQNIKKLLQFIKKTVNYIFVPRFLAQELKAYNGLAQYRQIQQTIKDGGETLYFKRNLQSSDEESRDANDLVYFSSQFCSSGLSECQYENYLKIILSTERIQSIDHLIAMVFSCIRFDQKNLQFSDKVKIAQKISPLLMAYITNERQYTKNYRSKDDESEGLKKVKTLTRLIFIVCVDHKPSKWANQYIFDVFQQLIILNDYLQFLERFFQFLEQKQSQIPCILVYLEVMRLFQSFQLLKIYDEKPQQVNEMFCKSIKDNLRKINIGANSQYENGFVYDINSFIKMDNKQITKKSLQSYEKQLKCVKNPKIRKYLLVLFTYRTIKAHLELGMRFQLVKLIQTVKKSINFFNLDLLTHTKLIIYLMYLTHNKASITRYFNYVSSIINCPQIFKNFDTSKHLQQYDNSNYSKIDQLIEKLPLAGTEIYYQIYSLLCSWKTKQVQFDKQLHARYIKLYSIYRQTNTKIELSQENFSQSYLDLFKKALIECYFYELSQETKEAFQMSIKQSQSEFHLISNGQQQNKLYINFKKYEMFVNKYFFTLAQHQQEDCLYCLKQVIYLCKQANVSFIIAQLLKNFSAASWRWKKAEINIYSKTILYNYYKEFNQIAAYLTKNCHKLFLQTLCTFARYDQLLFYQILVETTNFLAQHSFHTTRSYFNNFVATIDEFLKRYGFYSHLIHFSKFQQQSLKANPYLLIFCAYSLFNEQKNSQLRLLKTFAVNCSYLSSFARQRLLEKYYRTIVIFMRSKSKRQRANVFRVAKNYIGKKVQKKFLNQIIKPTKSFSRHQLLKAKLKLCLQKD